jgi:hypothetical protein
VKPNIKKKIILTCSLTLIIASITTTSVIAYNLIQRFDTTKTWKRVSKAPLAELTPELLTADDHTKDLIQAYNKQESLIWNASAHNFKETPSRIKINKLQSLYNKLPKSYQASLKNYDEINKLYEILDKFNTITKNNTISDKQSLKSIQDYLKHSFDELYPYLAEDGHKAAENIYTSLQQLASDSNQYALILDTINKDYKIDKNRLTTDMMSEHIDYLNQLITKLHFKWNYIENKIKPLIKNSESAVKSNEQAVQRYNEYVNDQNAKAEFEQFEQQFITEQDRLKNLIIDLPDFTNKNLSELQQWTATNQISIKIIERDISSKSYDIVLEQIPAKSKYDKIVKGSTITVVVNVKKQTIPSESTQSSSSDVSRETENSQPRPSITKPTISE